MRAFALATTALLACVGSAHAGELEAASTCSLHTLDEGGGATASVSLPPSLVGTGTLEKRRFKHPEQHHESGPATQSVLAGTGRYAHRFFELGVTVGPASPVLAPGVLNPSMSLGLHLADNDIILGRLFFIIFGAAARTQTHEHTSTTYRSDGDGNVYRIDTYRPLTGQEIAERDRVFSEAIAGRYVGELNFWFSGSTKDEATSATGGFEYRVGENVPLTRSDAPILFQYGIQFAYARIKQAYFAGGQGYAPTADGKPWTGRLDYGNFGMFGRLIVPISRLFEGSVTWDPNFFALAWSEENKAKGLRFNSPLRASLSLNVTDYVFVKNEWMAAGISKGTISWNIHVGGRI